MQPDLASFVVIFAVAALAPVLAAVPRRMRVAVVVVEILLGIVVGPDVLDLARTDPFIDTLSDMGLAALFFLAGAEIDPPAIRGAPMRVAGLGWLGSLGLALGAAFLLESGGLIDGPVVVAIALATTALGVLVPILRDAGLTGTPLGTMALAAGAVGEVGPIVLVSVFLAAGESSLTEGLLLGAFVAATLALAFAAPRLRSAWLSRLIRETMDASGQLAIRICILLLVALVWLAVELRLELVLGAFAAGILLGLVTRETPHAEVLRTKLDAIAFGFLVPIFFIHSGLTFDLDGLLDSGSAMAQVPLFLVLFLVVRGAPALLQARRLPRGTAIPLALLSASTISLVVAVTEAGVREGELESSTAASLVGAAMLSVLIFPAIALALLKRRPVRGPDPEPEAL